MTRERFSQLSSALRERMDARATRRGGRNSGFTLVELLVVLAVVTILVAVLVPVFWSVRQSANSTRCLSNLKQLGAATALYAEQWDETLPEAPGTPMAGSISLSTIPNIGVLDPRLLRTLWPSQSSYVWGQLTTTDKSLSPGVFKCPNDNGAAEFGFPKGEPVYESALMSYLWDPAQVAALNGGQLIEEPYLVNGAALGMIENPSETRLFQDYGDFWHSKISSSVEPGQGDGEDKLVRRGWVNALFADGHVDKMPTTSLEVIGRNAPGNPGKGGGSSTPPIIQASYGQ